MSRVTRGTPAGDAYLDLQNQARRTGRPTEELLQFYALEGVLLRLSLSRVRDAFVLKGGVLLAAFDTRRPTRDVDLAGLDVSNDADAVLDHVKTVLAGRCGGLLVQPRRRLSRNHVAERSAEVHVTAAAVI